MPLDFRTRFLNVRVRLQSYKSARFSFGWISQVDNPHFGVDFVKQELGVPGDRYYVELNDGTYLMMADAVLLSNDGLHGTLVIDGPVRKTSQTMGLRMRTRLDGRLTVNKVTEPVHIVDVSNDGMGIVANMSTERMQYAEIEAFLPQGVLKLAGRAVYCYSLDEGWWSYRIGLNIPKLNEWIDPENGDLRKIYGDDALAA